MKQTGPRPTIAKHANRVRTRRRARGLAPLEMVMALPILLFVMALIINFGAVASWKVRGLSSARHALWASRWPRSLSVSPRPDYWPRSAQMGAQGAGDVPVLDDPRVDLPVVRGPLPNDTEVHRRLLDPTRGLREGDSHLRRRFALLARMGPYDQESHQHLLDNMWQYQRTSWPQQGQRIPESTGNHWRRIPVIYRLPRVPTFLISAYIRAAYAVLLSPFRNDLRPLETWKDDEFVGYAIRFRWPIPHRDFHPRLRHFCTLDPTVADEHVQDLIDRIQGKVEVDANGNVRRTPSVAEVLANAFIGLYERVIGAINGLEPETSLLNQKIRILEQFRTRLQNTTP